MVVCKCHKATNLYCFVHKVPVCGECISFGEHDICVVRTYSEWVIDGDYNWPPKCNLCHETLQVGESKVSRLGCLHVLHSTCLSKHLQSFPPHTAPAGYTCPACSAPIWPPKLIKDYSCAMVAELKERISQSGLSKTILANDPSPPSAFASPPVASFAMSGQTAVQLSDTTNNRTGLLSATKAQYNSTEIKEDTALGSVAMRDINGKTHSSLNMDAISKLASPTNINPGAMTRKPSGRGEKMGSNHVEYDAKDEDELRRKYNHGGPIPKQALKFLMPFTSNPSSLLPVTTPSRKDEQTSSYAEEIIEGRHRRRSRSSGVNTKKILLVLAIMSCMATMLLLYYRLLQGAPSEDITELNNNEVNLV